MLPLKLEDPVGVAPLSAFSVATRAPDTRTVPTGGTAGASVRSVSRSRPWAVAAEANAKRRVEGRRMAGQTPPPEGDASREGGVKALTEPDRSAISPLPCRAAI